MPYHYPRTARPAGRDQAEVEATKAARSESVPVFVITHSARHRLRDVRLGWVQDWDDAKRIFIVLFGNDAPGALPTLEEEDQEPFALVGDREKRQTVTTSCPGQATFKFRVLRRYPVACAVCPIIVPELLDAAHIREKRDLAVAVMTLGTEFCYVLLTTGLLIDFCSQLSRQLFV